jgi:AICAR transformylase/IMP cyclohydrolase PurH
VAWWMFAMRLKYGMNPHQRFADAEPLDPRAPPLQVLHGTPSLINFLDGLNGWQLVREARAALGVPAAASFKHVSPAGAAIATSLDDRLARVYEVDPGRLSPVALAYVRARGGDPKSSYGDFVALSEPVDESTAVFLKGVVSDGIIAPGYEPRALEILTAKKSGAFIVFQADAAYEPPPRETREVFGMRLVQDRNQRQISAFDLQDVRCGTLDEAAVRDLMLGLITLKYTQSNSVVYTCNGQTIGIGAGQQSRVDCTKLAGAKADLWQLGQHPKVLALAFRNDVKTQDRINWRVRYIEGDLPAWEADDLNAALDRPSEPLTSAEKRQFLATIDGVSLVSDGFIPFRDNVDRAAEHGVRYIAQPGGAARDAEVEAACQALGITMVHTGLRLFHH